MEQGVGLDAPREKHATAEMLVAAACVILALWVQRHSLVPFFSSPDDLVHLQEAVGLKPIQPTPFRFVSQVLYLRAMVFFFGLNPLPRPTSR